MKLKIINKIIKPVYFYIFFYFLIIVISKYISNKIGDFLINFFLFILPIIILFFLVRTKRRILNLKNIFPYSLLCIIPGFVVGFIYGMGFILAFGHSYDYMHGRIVIGSFVKELLLFSPPFILFFSAISLAIGIAIDFTWNQIDKYRERK